MKEEDKKILARILEHFEEIAPVIVRDSVLGLSTGKPHVDLYDCDFYMEKLAGACDDVPTNRLRNVLEENIEKVNHIFFRFYKDAKITTE